MSNQDDNNQKFKKRKENKQKKNSNSGSGNSNKKSNGNDAKPENNSLLKFLLIALLVTFMINMVVSSYDTANKSFITYDEFLEKLDAGEVSSVEIQADRLVIYEKSVTEIENDAAGITETPVASTAQPSLSETLSNYMSNPNEYTKKVEDSKQTVLYTGTVGDLELVNRLEDSGIEYYRNIQNNNPLVKIFTEWILPLLLIYGLMMLTMTFLSKKMGSGGGGIFSVGKSNAKIYKEDETGVTFKDVAGQEEAKESLIEIVDYLYHPEKYKEIGAKQPKGALLVGPPGTGKTLLAKAVAGEAKVPFFSLSGSDFVEMFVGVGASRVRDLFKQANDNAPCIIFIDELDAIGKSRDSAYGGNDEREQTLNQLLSEMDGFDSSKGVVVLAATNRPEILDPALLRPGRFDRRVIVEKPDLSGRKAILEVHASKVKLSDNVDMDKIAMATWGAVGADLANIINEAALRAVKMGRKEVEQEDLMEAVEVIIAGKEKKDRVVGDKEKKIIAYHEVGHALTAALQKGTQPVQKITIVPRTMGSLGYTMQMPEEEKYLSSKDDLLAEITVFLGGRAAEVLEFNVETTGASNDIERATQMARNMVTLYGMSEKFQMMSLETVQDKYLGGRRVSTCSEATGREIDNEIRDILSKCFDKAKELLSGHRVELSRIADYLLEKENISGEEFMKLLNNETIEEHEIAVSEPKEDAIVDENSENSETSDKK